MLVDIQDEYWGFDFQKNGEIYKPEFGQYSTEIFTTEAQRIVRQHDSSQVCFGIKEVKNRNWPFKPFFHHP